MSLCHELVRIEISKNSAAKSIIAQFHLKITLRVNETVVLNRRVLLTWESISVDHVHVNLLREQIRTPFWKDAHMQIESFVLNNAKDLVKDQVKILQLIKIL